MACRELLLQQSLNRREVRGLDSTQSRGFPSAHLHSRVAAWTVTAGYTNFATSGRNLQLTYRQRSVNVPVNVAKMLAGGEHFRVYKHNKQEQLVFLAFDA